MVTARWRATADAPPQCCAEDEARWSFWEDRGNGDNRRLQWPPPLSAV